MMEDAVLKDDLDDFSDLPPLPAFVYSKDGQKIDTSSTIWIGYVSPDGGRRMTINWSLLERPERQHLFTRRIYYIIKLYLADCLAREKIGTVLSTFQTFQAFEQWLVSQYNTLFTTSAHRSTFDWSDLTEGIIRSFLAYDIEN